MYNENNFLLNFDIKIFIINIYFNAIIQIIIIIIKMIIIDAKAGNSLAFFQKKKGWNDLTTPKKRPNHTVGPMINLLKYFNEKSSYTNI